MTIFSLLLRNILILQIHYAIMKCSVIKKTQDSALLAINALGFVF